MGQPIMANYLQQLLPKIQYPFVLWVALQVKGSIPIFSLLQQQDLKDNTLCKQVSKREDTQIWVMPLLIPKMGLLYGYSVEGYRYCVGDPFWVWVSKWVSHWRQPKKMGVVASLWVWQIGPFHNFSIIFSCRDKYSEVELNTASIERISG